MFWPDRVLSILFVNTLTWEAACGRTMKPLVKANMATTKMPFNLARRSECMHAPFKHPWNLA